MLSAAAMLDSLSEYGLRASGEIVNPRRLSSASEGAVVVVEVAPEDVCTGVVVGDEDVDVRPLRGVARGGGSGSAGPEPRIGRRAPPGACAGSSRP